jgi:putative transposase
MCVLAADVTVQITLCLKGNRANGASISAGASFASLKVVPRQPRCFLPGLSCHITQRGNNRSLIFRAPSDYDVFLIILRHASERHAVPIHAYALMPNHIHLMVTPGSATALPRAMQAVGRRYVQYFNRRYGRSGGLWEGRYRPAHVHDERYWLTCMRYVELNPSRGGLVASPEQYQWSSYAHHAFGKPDRLITEHFLYTALGSSPKVRQGAWREICGQQITSEHLECIRRSIWAGFVLG